MGTQNAGLITGILTTENQMAEGVVAQVKEGVTAPAKALRSKPLMALTVALVAVSIVVLIEIFKPGLITGKIRKAFGMVGIKGAA